MWLSRVKDDEEETASVAMPFRVSHLFYIFFPRILFSQPVSNWIARAYLS